MITFIILLLSEFCSIQPQIQWRLQIATYNDDKFYHGFSTINSSLELCNGRYKHLAIIDYFRHRGVVVWH